MPIQRVGQQSGVVVKRRGVHHGRHQLRVVLGKASTHFEYVRPALRLPHGGWRNLCAALACPPCAAMAHQVERAA
jgi:hypothetical protein